MLILARLAQLLKGPRRVLTGRFAMNAGGCSGSNYLPSDRLTERVDARFMRVPGPSWFRLTADAGSIAVGLGVALGAAVGRPRAAHVLFIGDGGLSMTLGDLETAARHSIPLIVVVMNDRAYGSDWVHLEADGLSTQYAELPEIDFTAVARSLGVDAVRARSVTDLESIAPRLCRRESPLVIDCRIRPDITADRLRWDRGAPLGA